LAGNGSAAPEAVAPAMAVPSYTAIFSILEAFSTASLATLVAVLADWVATKEASEAI